MLKAALTANTKWDGIALHLENDRINPVLVEFSGGINFNATSLKENSDESKLIEGMTTMLR